MQRKFSFVNTDEHVMKFPEYCGLFINFDVIADKVLWLWCYKGVLTTHLSKY